MKPVPVLMSAAVLCLALLLPAAAQEAPAKWGPGCNKALLEGEFSLTKAPEMPCSLEKRRFIDMKIYGVRTAVDTERAMARESAPDLYMDTPEFTALFLRAFADPGQSFSPYSDRMDGLIGRLRPPWAAFRDARLDWDLWRAWLLFENTGHATDRWRSPPKNGAPGPERHLYCAREVLWSYLYINAADILQNPSRRAWWLTRLTADLTAPGGRPWRRWFLLLLLTRADPQRETLLKNEARTLYPAHGHGAPLRQPRPLDPFLVVTGADPQIPAFAEAVTHIALTNKLSLTVLGLDPAAQPATMVETVNLLGPAMPPGSEANIIYQESWSSPPANLDKLEVLRDYEWGRNLPFTSPKGYYGALTLPYTKLILPEDRTDGVYFFVYNQRLYIWPKANMDAGVIQLLRTASLITAPAAAALEKHGLVPLKETLVKEWREK